MAGWEQNLDTEHQQWLVYYKRQEKEMGNYDDLYSTNSEYLKAEEWPAGKKAKLAIASHILVEFDDNKPKAALHFEGKEKGIVLNSGNYARLKSQLGEDCDGWVGKTIFVSTETIPSGTYKGKFMFRLEADVEASDEDLPF